MFRSALLICLVLTIPALAEDPQAPLPRLVPPVQIPQPMPEKKDEPPPKKVQFDVRMEAHLLITMENLFPEEVLKNEIQWMPALLQGVPEVAVEMELMDPREVRYFFQKPEDFPSEMRTINARHHDLKDAPLVSDSYRFPDRNLINELIKFNRAYNKHLDEYAAWNLDRAHLARQVQKENTAMYQAWDAMRDGKCEFYYITVRRQALKKLRHMLDDKGSFLKIICKDYANLDIDYTTGCLPPYVPTWRFEERR